MQAIINQRIEKVNSELKKKASERMIENNVSINKIIKALSLILSYLHRLLMFQLHRV